MILRNCQKDIEESLTKVPVVALLGSRQTGKTTLARAIYAQRVSASIYLDLALHSDSQALSNPQLYLEDQMEKLVIIDEVQRQPALFPLLRALVDKRRSPGRFLILGSASPALHKESSDSLAGRIRSIEVPPFHLPELPDGDWKRLWLRGGYPESYLAESDQDSLRWRLEYLSAFLERDIPNLGIRIPAGQLRRAWIMLAHRQAQLWNAAAYGNSLGLSGPTLKRYLDILTDTFMIRVIEPFYENVGKRLVKSPKTLIRDSGLVHALLGIGSMDQLLSHPVAGQSWESFCMETVIRNLGIGWRYSFYRTIAGAELDLVLESPSGKRYALEIKLGLQRKPTKGYYTAIQDLGISAGFILSPLESVARIDERITCTSPGAFVTSILPDLA